MSKHDRQYSLIPRVRFPEFRDEQPWTAKTLDKYCERLTATVGDAQLIPVSISSGVGFVAQADKFGRDISGAQYANYIRIQRGDFAYNRGNSKRFPQGCVYQLTEFDEAAASNAFYCFRLNEEWAPAFFEALFESNCHGQQLLKDITSSARSTGLLNIRADTFFAITIPMPNNKAEHHKIAECVGSLDDLIAAERRKLETLRDHKQGLMQQLFPKLGQTQPRLRFPEFREAGDWEDATVGSRCTSFSGGTPDTSRTDFYGGTIPFIRSAEIASDSTALFLTEKGLENSAARMVGVGEVLVALYGANSGDVALSRVEGAINQAILCLRPEGNKAFLYHYLTRMKARILATYLQGGQGNLSGEIVKSVSLRFPCKDEQHRIAECLSALDAQIAAQAAKLGALRTHKRGLMQQLFPSLSGTKA